MAWLLCLSSSPSRNFDLVVAHALDFGAPPFVPALPRFARHLRSPGPTKNGTFDLHVDHADSLLNPHRSSSLRHIGKQRVLGHGRHCCHCARRSNRASLELLSSSSFDLSLLTVGTDSSTKHHPLLLITAPVSLAAMVCTHASRY